MSIALFLVNYEILVKMVQRIRKCINEITISLMKSYCISYIVITQLLQKLDMKFNCINFTI